MKKASRIAAGVVFWCAGALSVFCACAGFLEIWYGRLEASIVLIVLMTSVFWAGAVTIESAMSIVSEAVRDAREMEGFGE